MKVDDFHNSTHPVLMDCSPAPINPSTNHHDDEPAFSEDEDDDIPLGFFLQLFN